MKAAAVTHPAAVNDTLTVQESVSGPLLPRGAVAPASADIQDQDDEQPTQNLQPTCLAQDVVTKMKQQRSAPNKKSALATRNLRLVLQAGSAAPSGPPPSQ